MYTGVITITLNPSIDKSFRVHYLIADHKLRCANPQVDPGGGGINVSKALHELDVSSRAVFFCGGRNGAHLCDLLSERGIESMPVWVEGETRENIVITEESSNKQYKLVAEGPFLSIREGEGLLERMQAEKWQPEIMVASGSLPPGLPTNYYARLAKWCRENGVKLVLDTSGEALEAAIAETPFLIKPNLRELSRLAGVEKLELNQVREAAKSLVARNCAQVIAVSMGPAGALLVSKEGVEQISAPTVRRESTVGAGDSMVAGMVWSLLRGDPPSRILKMGVACGTAATMNPGTRLFKREDVFKLADWIEHPK